ncbi:primosomal replication protein PriC [Candidatus Fukatsuia endosymbiont of Tuberolachnus salignus]|uniref:primosomal replication protein PriC n=1 Tax=Candidatus Fukatsuia endosymbiont of Tuberolachnus salignus TaxID=3077957 RepID=UPI00313E4019
MKTEELLQVLTSQIETLSERIDPQGSVPVPQTRFDHGLFSRHGTRLRDYLLEMRSNLIQLKQVVAENRLPQVTFLAEKLVAQVAALQSELATQIQLKKNLLPQTMTQNPYDKLAEHQGYERRLIAMIEDKENQLAQQIHSSEQQRIRKELDVIEGRLACCRQALLHIEKNIEEQENEF